MLMHAYKLMLDEDSSQISKLTLIRSRIAGTGTVGEIRFENADEAREALAMDGGDFQGSTIGVDLDMLYQDLQL
eukprot:s3503_g4.t1